MTQTNSNGPTDNADANFICLHFVELTMPEGPLGVLSVTDDLLLTLRVEQGTNSRSLDELTGDIQDTEIGIVFPKTLVEDIEITDPLFQDGELLVIELSSKSHSVADVNSLANKLEDNLEDAGFEVGTTEIKVGQVDNFIDALDKIRR